MTLAPCPTHGSNFRALHEPNFRGIVEVIEQLLDTVSGVGTTSYSKCALGYPWNFEGIVRALEDLNTTISGIQGGGGGGSPAIQAGSGIYLTTSGTYSIINANYNEITSNSIEAGSGVYLTTNNGRSVINTDYNTIVSGVLKPGSNISFIYGVDESITVNSSATVSGVQAAVYTQSTSPPETNGALWFDTTQGRTFVYINGSGWYQTNAEAIVSKSNFPPSGTGGNAPARDGSLWFNTLVGNLFVYDAMSSGWYEASPSRSFAYGETAPATTSVEGAGWFNTTNQQLQVWNGASWVPV